MSRVHYWLFSLLLPTGNPHIFELKKKFPFVKCALFWQFKWTISQADLHISERLHLTTRSCPPILCSSVSRALKSFALILRTDELPSACRSAQNHTLPTGDSERWSATCNWFLNEWLFLAKPVCGLSFTRFLNRRSILSRRYSNQKWTSLVPISMHLFLTSLIFLVGVWFAMLPFRLHLWLSASGAQYFFFIRSFRV